ncbi:hypothetical protein [Micromonospora thermarum]|uniref:Uncharacterized protein n=1 Tax=Micromonospora thermarum TaxID=2720024 RepID=A0ABX0Z328_9ACTN|nr:hypothetical protein [Micromonospora thermarum]NJP31537.1 hypothetical protein [Micromonospora thermarum]
MRGGLDETLARLARREEALRRRGAEPAAEGDTVRLPAPEAGRREAGHGDTGGGDVGRGDTGRGEAGRNAGPAWPGHRDAGVRRGEAPARDQPAGRRGDPTGRSGGQHRAETPGPDPVEEVAEAVRRIVARHPDLAVALRVEHGGEPYPLRVAWSGGSVTVSAEPTVTSPPAWPLSVRTEPDPLSGPDGVRSDPAARLADLIRRDPSLLTDVDPPR